MEKLPVLLLLILSFLLLSCGKEDIKLISGCCELPPSNASIGNAIVYVPNIFTPNDDGINEIFYISGDSIQSVIEFKITDNRGEIVFEAHDINANDGSTGWDGTVNGIVHKGLYYVSISLQAQDGNIGSFEAKVCNFPCGDIDEAPLLKCLYPDYWPCVKYWDDCLHLEPFQKCAQ